jgi:parvulin-like peptidyl-prolyl isomerase
MKRTQITALLLLACLSWACSGSPSFAMPGAGAVPARSATPEDLFGADAAKGHGSSSGRDPMESLTVPDNVPVLRVDGVDYSAKILKGYVRDVLEQRAATDNELLGYADDMALDIAGYDVVLREMPSLKDDIRVVQAVAKFKSRVLPDIYFAEEVRKKVNPTVEDILSKVPEPAAKYEVSVIINPEEAKIDAAARAISEGQPFDAVARKFSDGMAAEKGGKIGALIDGKYDLFTEAEFRVVKSLKDGEVSKPFMSRIGWAILRLEKFWSPDVLRRLEAEENFETYKAEARKNRFRELYEDIEKRSTVSWNDNSLDRIRIALDNNLPLDDELRSSEVFRVNGFPVYALEIESLSAFHSPKSLDTYLEKRKRMELLSQEAEHLGYAVQVETLIDICRRRAVTRQFFKNKSRTFVATEKDLKEYYAKNKEKFTTEEQRKLLVIEMLDRKKADEVFRKAKKGQDFRKLAGSYSYKEEQRKLQGEVGFLSRSSLQPAVGEVIFNSREGAVLGPLSMKDPEGKMVYAVVKVEAIRKPELQPIEKINKESVAGKIVAGRMEEYYKEFIGSVSKGHKVEVLLGNGGGAK